MIVWTTTFQGMIVWTTTFHGHWVGGAAVVVAPTEFDARRLLDAELAEHGLRNVQYELDQLHTDGAHAVVLNDGDY